ncbi:uncharacterized protein J8A68_001691 [[Candida] subhashii]|uniref:Uncharacterized protein n=1 Tax=[Candida] subhashii TaxID=561895 RepID=A0A8J5QNJ1_9ASCO|nr:uncharacterized protein J8A68_001691 [[Candida] subhashii]KAG7664809.1 hypothetical protein J8A68_001691 [[Candida] subhashii]
MDTLTQLPPTSNHNNEDGLVLGSPIHHVHNNNNNNTSFEEKQQQQEEEDDDHNYPSPKIDSYFKDTSSLNEKSSVHSTDESEVQDETLLEDQIEQQQQQQQEQEQQQPEQEQEHEQEQQEIKDSHNDSQHHDESQEDQEDEEQEQHQEQEVEEEQQEHEQSQDDQAFEEVNTSESDSARDSQNKPTRSPGNFNVTGLKQDGDEQDQYNELKNTLNKTESSEFASPSSANGFHSNSDLVVDQSDSILQQLRGKGQSEESFKKKSIFPALHSRMNDPELPKRHFEKELELEQQRSDIGSPALSDSSAFQFIDTRDEVSTAIAATAASNSQSNNTQENGVSSSNLVKFRLPFAC